MVQGPTNSSILEDSPLTHLAMTSWHSPFHLEKPLYTQKTNSISRFCCSSHYLWSHRNIFLNYLKKIQYGGWTHVSFGSLSITCFKGTVDNTECHN